MKTVGGQPVIMNSGRPKKTLEQTTKKTLPQLVKFGF